MTANIVQPVYEHGCSHCTYLGQHVYDGTMYDLYFCLQVSKFPTVIARYGSDGPDYFSGLLFGLIDSGRREAGRPLGMAYRRSVELGLLQPAEGG